MNDKIKWTYFNTLAAGVRIYHTWKSA